MQSNEKEGQTADRRARPDRCGDQALLTFSALVPPQTTLGSKGVQEPLLGPMVKGVSLVVGLAASCDIPRKGQDRVPSAACVPLLSFICVEINLL